MSSSSSALQPQTAFEYGQSFTSTDCSIPPFLEFTAAEMPALPPKYVYGIEQFNQPYERPFISDKPLPVHWCAINYYEYDRKVGGTFQAPSESPQVFVDGGLSSSGASRFCLGSLTNTERSEAAEKCRRNLGKGIRLDLKGEGDVWLTVLGKHPIFVQSHFLDLLTERDEPEHAHKFVQYTTVKIFDLQKCCECWERSCLERNVNRRLQQDQQRSRRQRPEFGAAGTSANNNSSQMQPQPNREESDDETATDDPGVDDFRRLCTIRISFFKGFGLSYPRQTIQKTPCWIELQLHRALQLLDEVLNTPQI